MKQKFFIVILLFVAVFTAHAADLRGKLTGVSGAKIAAKCGKASKSANIASSGSFNLSGLPVNQSCYFTVSSGKSVSAKIPFNTKNNVTEYRGILRVVGKKVIVVRK